MKLLEKVFKFVPKLSDIFFSFDDIRASTLDIALRLLCMHTGEIPDTEYIESATFTKLESSRLQFLLVRLDLHRLLLERRLELRDLRLKSHESEVGPA